METLKIRIAIIDDRPETIQVIKRELEKQSSWKNALLKIDDVSIVLEPIIDVISPSKKSSANKFFEELSERIFAHTYTSSAESDQYEPYNVFIVDYKYEKLNWLTENQPIGWPSQIDERPDGILLCKLFKKYIPNAFCCLATVHQTDDMTAAENEYFDHSIDKLNFANSMHAEGLVREITDFFQNIASTPTWKGLQKYSTETQEIMHAMAAGDGKNVSATTQTFIEKFGSTLFFSEASLTLAPLDSLLSPVGCIKESQDHFAKVFGARKARFATNGTTGSNGILWASLFNDKEIVLVDKNCHISHHYSAAKQGVTPYFLEPQIRFEPDIYGPPSIETVINAIEDLHSNKLLKKLKGIVLTNCTFDGYILNASDYITKIDSKLRELKHNHIADAFVYYFDEAWFGFARFDPGLIRYTAMFAAKYAKFGGARRPRVYATQSVHKTLTAMRQASVILEYDEGVADSIASGLDSVRFQQSYLSQTTTSPSAPIVASLDIAKRQMCLEGGKLIQDSVKSAKRFSRLLKKTNWPLTHSMFSTTPSIPSRKIESTNELRDPTKLTIFHKLPVSGSEAKKFLWNKGGIQINKFGRDTFMFMFMPGFKSERVDSLRRKLEKMLKNENVTPSDILLDKRKVITTKSRFINQSGKICTYPIELMKSGKWGAGQVLFGNLGKERKQVKISNLNDKKDYVMNTFITPYPPGFPIIYPGQVLTGKEIKASISTAGEVHGIQNGDQVLVSEV